MDQANVHFSSAIRTYPLRSIEKIVLALMLFVGLQLTTQSPAFAESGNAQRIISLGPDVTEIILVQGIRLSRLIGAASILPKPPTRPMSAIVEAYLLKAYLRLTQT